MSELAAELEIVLPVSFFERAHNAHYNALAILDADGRNLGLYRKSHVPDGPGYQEKFYFNPGDTGFKAWRKRHASIGAAVCWDQWFPEAARAMALQGAELLLATRRHAPPESGSLAKAASGANMTPIIASNRTGSEAGESCALTFYGASFIADQTGAIAAEVPREERALITASFDLEAIRALGRHLCRVIFKMPTAS